MAELVQFKFTMVDLELIVSEAKEVMEDCIRRIREYNKETYGELRENEYFDGYWRIVYRRVAEKFGNEKAREFQKKMLIHHYNITKDTVFGRYFESAIKNSIGFDMDWDGWDEYSKELKEYQKSREK